MRPSTCCRIHPKQLVKLILLFSILWIAFSFIWSHSNRKGDPGNTRVSYMRKGVTQEQLDYISNNLHVHYQLIRNEEKTFTAEVTLLNAGNLTIKPCCWTIFFYHFNILDAANIRTESLDRLTFFHDDSLKKPEKTTSGFEISHVNGNTYRLDTLQGFQGLKPGTEVKIDLSGQRWIVSRSQVLPNWYVVSADPTVVPRLLSSTFGDGLDFVGSFESREQTRRSPQDALHPFTPEERFEMNAVKDFGGAPQEILPSVQTENSQLLPKEMHLESFAWSVSFGKGLINEASYLKEQLNIESFTEVENNVKGDTCSTKSIFLHLVDDLPLGSDKNKIRSLSEAYKLTVDPDKECVSIAGTSSAGVFYGAVSLVSLSKKVSHGEFYLTGVHLVDGPRFEHRGVMVDVARNFHSKEEIMRLIDALAMYKMNKLHLHLADDEGWRLEIPGLEELTQFGSQRGHDPSEQRHLMSMLGSGPFVNSSSGSGFYSVSTYRAILRHARSRHIEIIPEFDMPGHSHAAVRSMDFRSARLARDGHKKQATDYVLSDPLDKSSYLSAQFFTDGVMNPCLDSTYRFVNHVISEVVKMHKDLMPLKRFHFGGDEVPNGAYAESPACKEFLHNHATLSSTKDLKRQFIGEVSAMLDQHGVAVEGWEDAFSDAAGNVLPRTELKAKEVYSQAWYNIWERDYVHRTYEYANAGYKVILSPATVVYFDNPQEPDPEDWGLHWATRYVDTRRTFFFAPDSLYDNIDFDFFGARISKKQMCGSKIRCPELKSPENIVGLEAAMWSEVIRTRNRMDSMLWPRLLAVAERSWYKADWEMIELDCDDPDQCPKLKDQRQARWASWTKFANMVGYKELQRLEDLGINYYLPRPGARVVEGRLEVNTLFPGLVVQTSLDGGVTWNDFVSNSSYKGDVLLATRSFDGKRRSVPVEIKVA